MDPEHFARVLRSYCYALNASVTSYGRTATRNKLVGGVPGSAHRFWVGADVVYDNPVSPAERIATGARLGLRVIVEDDHDHLQPMEWPKG